jgi:branched-chain amino acid transport system permease protein
MNPAVLARANVPVAFGVFVLAVWPFIFASPYDHRVLTIAGIYALLVIGYQFVFGHAGALALTQGAFFGLGAYVTGILGARHGWPFLATFPLSIAVPAVLALLVAAPVLRLATHYFALATLGIAQVLLLVCLTWEPVTGGANGIAGVPAIEMGDLTIGRGLPLLAFVWAWVVAGAWLARRAMRGLYGLACHAMRENETAAQCIGLDTGQLRLVAFLLSAAYAGAAGALFAPTIRVVSPEVLEFQVMVACLAMAVVGGRTRVSGAILGAVLLVHLPEWFRALEAYYLIAYGAVLLLMIVMAPDGLIGALDGTWKRFAPPEPPSLPAPVPVVRMRPRSSATPLLAVRTVSKSFGGVRALDRVSLELRRGEILGLIGPNGSGKTTLVNAISGLCPIDAGEIRFGGKRCDGQPPFTLVRRGLARTFQNLNLVDTMTALDNVAIARVAAERIGLGRAVLASGDDPRQEWARANALFLLERLGVGDVALRPVGELPHALRRRVEIARALALEPDLVLLDEPAAGLSEAEQLGLADQLMALRTDGVVLLIIEHNMPFLMPLADRVVCLDQGRVIASGTPEQVANNPLVIEAYLGVSPADGGTA